MLINNFHPDLVLKWYKIKVRFIKSHKPVVVSNFYCIYDNLKVKKRKSGSSTLTFHSSTHTNTSTSKLTANISTTRTSTSGNAPISTSGDKQPTTIPEHTELNMRELPLPPLQMNHQITSSTSSHIEKKEETWCKKY